MNLQQISFMLGWNDQRRWSQYIYDSLLALAGILLLTGLIALLDLSARIPDGVLLYLFVILILAYLRGLYAALLASVIAFFTFDFLFVPPLYSLRISKFDDVLTLIVFLVTAAITAQLAVVVKRYRENVEAQARSQADGLRAALLSSVSHNLRTPLSTIKTAATSIQQEKASRGKETQGNLITILQETDRLDSLVENLLDMSRIEAGVLCPEKNWYIISELVYDVLGRMHSQLEGRPISVHIPDQLTPVELDYVHIDQILTNLVENAVYYTPAGSPLEIHIKEMEEHVQVSVADRGAGIPEAEREQIFNKFYRLQKAGSSVQHKGTGLGLAICRGLIEGHRGQIWVEERTGGGARFCFTLPKGSMKGTDSWDA